MNDDELRKLREAVEAAMRGEMRVGYATPTHPILAALFLQIAQTYLLEMMKSEPPGRRPADQAYQFVAKAVSILTADIPKDE